MPKSTEVRLLAVVCVLFFVVSYRGLNEVAHAAGWGWTGPALPLILDGNGLIAALSVERISRRGARAYAWLFVLVLAVASALANAATAGGVVHLSRTAAAVVCAAPPLLLALTFHLLRVVSADHDRQQDRTELAVVRLPIGLAPAAAHLAVDDLQAEGPVAALTPPSPPIASRRRLTTAAEPSPPGPAQVSRSPYEAAARRWWLGELKTGRNPTAAGLSRAVGCSPGGREAARPTAALGSGRRYCWRTGLDLGT